MEIKRLNRENIEEIKELWQDLNAHHRELSTHFKRHFATFTFSQRIEKLTIKEKLIVFLAKMDEVKIGYCLATYDKAIGEIDSIYIRPEYRGNGIGEKLMSEAMHWLEQQEWKEINIYIAEGNEGAIDFYRKNNPNHD